MAQNKSTWWSVTAFNAEISQLESAEFPEFVAKVYGGREKCPETGREHFQGAIQCRRQVRMTQLKTWLPTAHLEPARNVDALKKYAMKEETAVGEKTERSNAVPMVTIRNIMEWLSHTHDELNLKDYIDELVKKYGYTVKKAKHEAYWRAVRELLTYNECARNVCHLFSRADVKDLWYHTGDVWVCPRGVSITPPEGDLSGNPV